MSSAAITPNENSYPETVSPYDTTETPASNNVFEALVSEADRLWHDFALKEIIRCFELVSGVHKVLARLYAVHVAGKRSTEEYRAFLKARNVAENSRALNEYHPTVLAFIPAEDRPRMRQRTSQYAQVLFVMGEQGVAPDKAQEWLAKTQPVGGKKVSGITKALRLYARLPIVQERNKEDRARAQAERARTVERALKKLERKPIAEVAASRSLATYKGQPLILLARVEVTGSLKDSERHLE